MSILARARPDLIGLAGYSTARAEAGAAAVMLNANESPWSAFDHEHSNRYPDPQPSRLRDALASLYGVNAAQVLVGRGSDEGIDLLTRAFCRAGVDEVIVAVPTFGMYAVAAAVQGARVVSVPRSPASGFAYPFAAVRAAVTGATRLVFVCTPNNPTGDVVARADVLALTDDLRGRAMVVVDEAYVEFTDGASLCADVAARDNLAVLRTLSKAHALAAARIGTLVAAPDVIALCRRLMAPYPLPAACVTQALAALQPAALARSAARVAMLWHERERMHGALTRLPAVREVLPSQANFLTVRFDDGAAAYARLLARGVVVRDVGRQHGLADCLRCTIGTPAENDTLLAALSPQEAAA